MKKALTFVVLIILTLTSISIAQTSLEDYKRMDYIKVEEGQMESFLKLSQSELQSKFQSLSESGLIKSWALYKAQYPGGEKSSYDFISVIRTTDIDKLLEQFNPISSPDTFKNRMLLLGITPFSLASARALAIFSMPTVPLPSSSAPL